MATIKAEFDGRVFVPAEPVTLPVGTAVEVVVSDPFRRLTPEEMREWEVIRLGFSATDQPFPTVDEFMRYARKRP
jgi:hypothetical protein